MSYQCETHFYLLQVGHGQETPNFSFARFQTIWWAERTKWRSEQDHDHNLSASSKSVRNATLCDPPLLVSCSCSQFNRKLYGILHPPNWHFCAKWMMRLPNIDKHGLVGIQRGSHHKTIKAIVHQRTFTFTDNNIYDVFPFFFFLMLRFTDRYSLWPTFPERYLRTWE